MLVLGLIRLSFLIPYDFIFSLFSFRLGFIITITIVVNRRRDPRWAERRKQTDVKGGYHHHQHQPSTKIGPPARTKRVFLALAVDSGSSSNDSARTRSFLVASHRE